MPEAHEDGRILAWANVTRLSYRSALLRSHASRMLFAAHSIIVSHWQFAGE